MGSGNYIVVAWRAHSHCLTFSVTHHRPPSLAPRPAILGMRSHWCMCDAPATTQDLPSPDHVWGGRRQWQLWSVLPDVQGGRRGWVLSRTAAFPKRNDFHPIRKIPLSRGEGVSGAAARRGRKGGQPCHSTQTTPSGASAISVVQCAIKYYILHITTPILKKNHEYKNWYYEIRCDAGISHVTICGKPQTEFVVGWGSG